MLPLSRYPSYIPDHPLATAHTKGRVHAITTERTNEGTGIQYMVFTQGCPLRCLYCNNLDCREICGGETKSIDEIMTDIHRYQPDIQSPGSGVVVTGGEPLLQPEFTTELLFQCQHLGIHTTLDTSGYSNLHSAKHVVQNADIVLLDIKSFDPVIYSRVTSVSLEPTLQLAQYLNNINKPTWIRFVVVPGLTDPEDNVDDLAQFIAPFKNVERVEVIPFQQMEASKWAALGHGYTLSNTPTPDDALMERVRQQFRRRGLVVV
ncbi:MAG: pyruvate formate-lyase-activating protein [Leptolyngbyaceae cyanobacterium]